MREEFDPDALHRLVDEALEERPQTPPPASPSKRLPFAFSDTRLLQTLADLLPKYVHQADAQVLLHELRNELYEGISLGNLRDMHNVIAFCRKCPAMEPNPQPPVWNLADPDVVFVGEGPARGGKPDDFFIETLKRAGFSSSRVALTGATRCRVSENRAPVQDEYTNCRGYLYAEIQLLRPKLVVTLGNGPTTQFVGPTKITEDHGKIYWVGPWPIMPTLPPAYVLRANLQDKFLADLVKAHNFVYGEVG